ncbi:MAG: M1 family metallopeptidase [Planctomycetota bacterium]
MNHRSFLRIAILMLFTAIPASAQPLPHSFARPSEAVVKHLHLDLVVDFETKTLSGAALLTISRSADANRLVLDIQGLKVSAVTCNSVPLAWKLGESKPQLGRPLEIELPAGNVDTTHDIKVEYQTRPSAAALQWLSPEQTTDKKHPFLFTQSQAILARTWVPCQDTPAVRMTYSAKVQVPKELMAVMSAENPRERNRSGVYEFKMDQPIPSYLLALAVGDLEFKPLGPRSGVYCEPSVLEKAVWELHDTERMIAAAEELYGPYRWDRYDVIVLPSSFPFGGMENPRLTFATPTILAGDRSLVALIAHELAHSWSGNLVTNSTWNDFWLNEGFTVYFEQRIMEAIYGRQYSEMLARLTLDGLLQEIEELDERDTWLKLDLAERNPDDGMTAIAYDKGYFFLRRCEEEIGREKWDAFLKGYFDKFAFKSMTTEGFVQYLRRNLETEIDIDAWVYRPGLPESCPTVETDQLAKVTEAAQDYLNGVPASSLRSKYETDAWTTHHWNHFLRRFKLLGLSVAQMETLDKEFKFTESGNSEITHDWMWLVIAAGYEPGYEKLEFFLTSQGRRKFLTPLYRKLAQTDHGLAMARRIYSKARPGYHPVSSQTIDDILGKP